MNNWVDLGFHSIWEVVPENTSAAVGAAFSSGKFLAQAVDKRDRIKAIMDAENGGLNWEVGRVALFSAIATERAFGFTIKRLVAGTPSGEEWFIMLGAPGTTGGNSNMNYMFGVAPYNDFERASFYFGSTAAIGSGNPTRPYTTTPNVGIAVHYHKGGILPARARGARTFTSQPTNGATVTIDGKTYTFQTTLTNVDGNVAIGATVNDSVDNLVAAIGVTATTRTGKVGPGVSYANSTTAHTTVDADAFYLLSTPDLMVSAKTPGAAGNSISISGTGAGADWNGQTTLVGGGASNSYGVGAGVDGDPPEISLLKGSALMFFPDEKASPWAYGLNIPMTVTAANYEYPSVMVFNHAVPFVGVYAATSGGPAISDIIILGEILEPRDPADTSKSGVFGWNAGNTCGWNSGTLMDSGIVAEMQVSCLDINGDKSVQTGIDLHTAYTPYNQPRYDGTFDADPIRIYGKVFTGGLTVLDPSLWGYVKGFIRKDVVAIQGWYDAGLHQLFEARYGVALKVDRHIVVPWVTNAPIPFFGLPANNPQPHAKT